MVGTNTTTGGGGGDARAMGEAFVREKPGRANSNAVNRGFALWFLTRGNRSGSGQGGERNRKVDMQEGMIRYGRMRRDPGQDLYLRTFLDTQGQNTMRGAGKQLTHEGKRLRLTLRTGWTNGRLKIAGAGRKKEGR